MMGLGLLVPVIPWIVQQFRADALTIGWLSLVYSASQFVATPLLGAISDRFGRRPILLISFLGSAFAYFAFGWAGVLWVLFLGRLVDGLTGANIGTSQAYIADITTPELRSRAMALVGAALGAGFVVGPLVGVGLSVWGLPPTTQAIVAGGLAIGSTIVAWWFLPESLPASRRRALPLRLAHLNPLAPLLVALRRTPLRALLVATFLANFAMAGLRSHFAFFTFAQLNFSQGDVNQVMAFLGVMMVIAQGGLVRQAVHRWGDLGTLILGLGLSVIGFFGLSLAAGTPMVYTMVAITALGVGLGTPTMAALVSQRSGAVEQGAMLGAAQAAASLGHVIGPLWAGLMFDRVGPGFPFSTGAALVACALVVVLISRRPPAIS